MKEVRWLIKYLKKFLLQNRSDNVKLPFWPYEAHVNTMRNNTRVETTTYDIDFNTKSNKNAIVDSIMATMPNLKP